MSHDNAYKPLTIFGEFPVCRQAGIWPKDNNKLIK